MLMKATLAEVEYLVYDHHLFKFLAEQPMLPLEHVYEQEIIKQVIPLMLFYGQQNEQPELFDFHLVREIINAMSDLEKEGLMPVEISTPGQLNLKRLVANYAQVDKLYRSFLIKCTLSGRQKEYYSLRYEKISALYSSLTEKILRLQTHPNKLIKENADVFDLSSMQCYLSACTLTAEDIHGYEDLVFYYGDYPILPPATPFLDSRPVIKKAHNKYLTTPHFLVDCLIHTLYQGLDLIVT